MKIVKVTYTAKAGYAEQNQLNIKTVMGDLQQLNHPGIFYHACLKADGKTFIHTAFFKSDEDEKVLLGLASFKTFQEQLKASGPEVPPQPELLTLVGSSTDIFSS
jgi:hypothetical protein